MRIGRGPECTELGKPEDVTWERWRAWTDQGLEVWRVPAPGITSGPEGPLIVGCRRGAGGLPGGAPVPEPARPPWAVVAPPGPARPPWAGGPGAAETLNPGQSLRLLRLAEASKAIVEAAIAKAALPSATADDKAAGAAAGACINDLVVAAGPLDAMLEELRRAAAPSEFRHFEEGARITLAQARALETYAECAQKAVAARAEAAKGGPLEAVIGVGLPAAAAALVAL